jgi:hypothetical protein
MRKILLTFIMFIVGCLILMGCTGTEECIKKKGILFKDDIVSLERNNEVSGSGGFLFVIGLAHINEKTYYYVYKKVHENEYKLIKINADIAHIVETNSEIPHIDYIFDHCETLDKEGLSSGYASRVKLFVPVGTIKKEFKG